MSRRVGLSLAVSAAIAVPAIAAAGGGQPRGSQVAVNPASGPRIGVKPKKGTPGARFVVGFRAPQAAGVFGGLHRYYVLRANGRQGPGGCASMASATVPIAAAQARVRVTLDPRRYGGKWCTGRFRGRIDEIQGPVCVKGQLCPAFATKISTIGKFSFRVKRSASGHHKSAR